ncbi:S-adenosyl-L-methionine-dependent methyltransferase [Aspergillus aurantiobrunneus]
MPRIATSIVLRAHKQDPLLPFLLRECRSLELAKNELRWLRERAMHMTGFRLKDGTKGSKHAAVGWRRLLKSMCLDRSRGMPLQYILGDQPFGVLDIKCTRGVLIPRQETETITFQAAKLILERIPCGTNGRETPLRIMDLCTGTGCIPLLLHALLSPHFPRLSIVGVDISAAAIKLARENKARNMRLGTLSNRALKDVQFRQRDVLKYGPDSLPIPGDMFSRTPTMPDISEPRIDVLISNPPYVSPEEYYDGTTSRSVRIFEPKSALVPPENIHSSISESEHVRHEDLFYYHFGALIVAFQVKMAVFECGSRLQAIRVATICRNTFSKLELKDSRLIQMQVSIWSVTGVDTDPCAVIVYSSGR